MQRLKSIGSKSIRKPLFAWQLWIGSNLTEDKRLRGKFKPLEKLWIGEGKREEQRLKGRGYDQHKRIYKSMKEINIIIDYYRNLRKGSNLTEDKRLKGKVKPL